MREIKFRVWDIREKGWFDEYNLSKYYYDLLSGSWGGVVVEQYTGMKDINGLEIYEGDIVRHHYWDGKYQTQAVEWCERDASDDMGTDMAGFQRFDKAIVIGNIHENPKLLEAS